MARGRLKVFLGAAPGVGKTFSMLGEAQRRAERGADVAVGLVETHGRARTAEMIAGLELIPRQHILYRDTNFEEMDVDAVIARAPEIAYVDELAHTNVPGSRNAKRWQDIEEILAAGINVVTTVNVQHLESLNDAVFAITGIRQQETVPDDVVRAADQIQLIDIPPEALRRRLAHGNVYQPEKIDASLASYFRVGNLTALRELALLWLADRVDVAMMDYRAAHRIAEPWPARERTVVAITGGPEGETLIRRAARIAKRGPGSEVMVLHVVRSDGLIGASPARLAKNREFTESLGGSFHTVIGDDVAAAVVDFATGANATLIIVGVSRRSKVQEAMSESVGVAVARLAGAIDVHLVTHSQARQGRSRPTRRAVLGRSRTIAGWIIAVLGPFALSLLLGTVGTGTSLATQLMLFLTLTIVVALTGGLWPAIVAAVLGTLALNFFFAAPTMNLTISDPENILSLVVFVLVAAAVASVVDLAARRTAQAAYASSEAAILASLAGSIVRGQDSPQALVERMRETFPIDDVTLLVRDGALDPWRVVATAGSNPAEGPDDGDDFVSIPGNGALVLRGAPLGARDRRVVEAFGAQMGFLIERGQLRDKAEQAQVFEQANAIRTALLAAVSHDLRTPLAAIRASIDGLLLEGVEWSPEDEAALLKTMNESTARLERLIDNLLDLSRLQSGAVRPLISAVSLDEVVPAALEGIPSAVLRIDIPETIPLTMTDRGLMERVVANIVSNAVRYSPVGQTVLVTASYTPRDVELRVIDRGPGIEDALKEQMFEPFQRLGDTTGQSPVVSETGDATIAATTAEAMLGHDPAGLGLGLAVARGLAEAVGAQIWAEDTPAGGLTMVVSMPRADAEIDGEALGP